MRTTTRRLLYLTEFSLLCLPPAFLTNNWPSSTIHLLTYLFSSVSAPSHHYKYLFVFTIHILTYTFSSVSVIALHYRICDSLLSSNYLTTYLVCVFCIFHNKYLVVFNHPFPLPTCYLLCLLPPSLPLLGCLPPATFLTSFSLFVCCFSPLPQIIRFQQSSCLPTLCPLPPFTKNIRLSLTIHIQTYLFLQCVLFFLKHYLQTFYVLCLILPITT